jgi:hypothetical protein
MNTDCIKPYISQKSHPQTEDPQIYNRQNSTNATGQKLSVKIPKSWAKQNLAFCSGVHPYRFLGLGALGHIRTRINYHIADVQNATIGYLLT